MSTETLAATSPVLEQSLCLNCNTPLHGHFCSHCGQHDRPLDPTVHDLFHELQHEFLHLDGKIFNTFRLLLFFPGRLSAEFLSGRRARFIGPVRLYLTASLLFFLVLTYQTDHAAHQKVDLHVDTQQAQQSGKQTTETDEDNVSLADSLKAEFTETPGLKGKKSDKYVPANKFEAWLKESLTKAFSDPKAYMHELFKSTSHSIFFLLPIFALALRITFRNRSQRYPAYVYFTLHYHAFAFLLFTLLILLQKIQVDLVQQLANLAYVLVPPIYLFYALRRCFGGTNKNTLIRVLWIGALYAPCLLFALLVAATLALVYS